MEGIHLTVEQPKEAEHSFMVSTDIFEYPKLDIYMQMVCVVLHYYRNTMPSLEDISRQGRMTVKQATGALQQLTDSKIISHKVFRQIIGEFADDRLSWAAKGLLTYCKTHPHAKLQDFVALSAQSGESESHIRKIVQELERHGYLEDFPELKRA